MKSSINEDNNDIWDETLMFYMKEFVLNKDKENLVYLENQSINEGQIFRTVIEMENHNYVLTRRDKKDLE